MREEPGQDAIVTGSIQLCHATIEAGLIDEYRMFVFPAWQGRGHSFFPEGYVVPRLKLLRSTSFAGGVTYAAYEPIRERGARRRRHSPQRGADV